MEENELIETARDIAADSSAWKSEEIKTTSIDDGEPCSNSNDSDGGKEITPQTTVIDYETSDTTESSGLQQQTNGGSPHHLRHRGTSTEQQTEREQDKLEPEISDLSASITKSTSKPPASVSDSASTSILDSSREDSLRERVGREWC